MTLNAFIEPLTGEWLEATDDRLKEARRDAYDEISRIRVVLVPIQAELADRAGPATLPPRRYRTDMQNATASCPRCGGRDNANARKGTGGMGTGRDANSEETT